MSHAPLATFAPPQLLAASELAALRVPHCFSTRIGGVSRGVFESLNFGNPGDLPASERDPVANIRENFRRVLEHVAATGREIVEVHQVHGAAVHLVRAGLPAHAPSPDGTRNDTKADAIVTDDRSRVLAIRVADCTPVLLASDDGRVVAAVHAGWRGVIAGVAPAAVSTMRELGARKIAAAIGPCIGPAHFEVGPEVVGQFERAFGAKAGPGEPIARRTETGEGFIDLQESLRRQLLACEVGAVEMTRLCTVERADLFFSHRREKGITGRMIGLIGPKG